LATHDDCSHCPLTHTRRDFLREGVGAALGVLATFGLSSKVAGASISWAQGALRADGVSYAIPAADGAQIDRDNQVILVRWQGSIYAFALACPHQKTALRWIEGDTRFQCPKHKSKYQPDGTFISGKATRGMDRYKLSRDGASVLVDTSVLYKQSEDMAGWKAAFVAV
jgi:nitrite reductase/ring-hydroxylating ferredoxin subunit